MGLRFNPPPGWPTPPEGWRPPPGWTPPPAWPAAPSGWAFWVDEMPAPELPEPYQPGALTRRTGYERSRWVAGATVAAVVSAAALVAMAASPRPVGALFPGPATSTSAPAVALSPAPEPSAGRATSALEVLDQLATRPAGFAATSSRYRGTAFGTWRDLDRNGCTTDDDVLRRDLVRITMGTGKCRVLSGWLRDRYSGTARRVSVRGGTVSVDYVVPLSDAWAAGAANWTTRRRLAFLNDQRNLQAVLTSTARDKAGRNAAGWLPGAAGYRCTYVARQVAVKAAYRLSVTAPERAAMRRVLEGCPGLELPR